MEKDIKLVVKTQIKEHAEYMGRPMLVSSDFTAELNKRVLNLIQEACRRAQSNGRNTVMGKDL